MQIILVRHAEAFHVGEQGATNDFDRALTPLGRDQAQSLADAFREQGVKPTAIVCSPLVRAVQTSEPLVKLLPGKRMNATECELLAPDYYRPKKLAHAVTELGFNCVVLVGHNPSISDFARWLLKGEMGCIDMDKASVLSFDCPVGPAKGEGVLRWYVTPEWLSVAKNPKRSGKVVKASAKPAVGTARITSRPCRPSEIPAGQNRRAGNRNISVGEVE